MALNEEPILSNNLYEEGQYEYQKSQDMDILNQVLGYNFSFDDCSVESNDTDDNNISSLLNSNLKSPTNLSDQQLNFIVPNISFTNNSLNPSSDDLQLPNNTPTKTSKIINNGNKRRRDPNQAHSHIIAERKRRELITQQFIALSALIPGLKKVDKVSILEEAIKYFQQMQDRVNELEKAKFNKVNVVESLTAVKSSQLIMDNNVVQNDSLTCCGSNDGYQNSTQPKIQVKMTQKTLLLRISCVRRKGILGQIYQDVENYVMDILDTNVVAFETSTLDITILAQVDILDTNVVAFETSTLDITILAQLEGGVGCEKQVRDLVTSLHSAIRIA